MDDQNKDDVIVKKIQPYPIPAEFSAESGVGFNGEIVKLTEHGFLVEMAEAVVHIQDRFQVKFELPTMGISIGCLSQVIKTYDRYNPVSRTLDNTGDVKKPESVATRLAEFHFIRPDHRIQAGIRKFLVVIGQIPG